jgi:hypothetical protein
VAVCGGRIDIVTTADYTLGGYPFSHLYRIFGNTSGDSVNNEPVSADTPAIYAERIYDLAVSNRFGRLTILYARGEFGGYNASCLIVSKSYPAISDYFYKLITEEWNGTVTPLSIVAERDSEVTVSIDGYRPSYLVTAAGLVAPPATAIRPVIAPAAKKEMSEEKVFDLLGRSAKFSPRWLNSSGIYFRRADDVPGQDKYLRVR